MRNFLFSMLAAALILTAATPKADETAPAIQSVIERQLAAFQANDLDRAFTFAAPTIQKMFGDPQNFGRMVRNGYPMVWRPARYEMMQLVQTTSGPVQVVLFEDAAGTLHEAGYLMKLVNGVWRIAGVHIRKRPGVGA